MGRKLRVDFPGPIYHVMSREDRREDIYEDDVDRQDFLKTLAEVCQKAKFDVHAYCLMSNHFHLVIETPEANLVAGMGWLLRAFTIGFNHRHQLTGQVFGRRYKAPLVEGSGSGCLKTVCDCVHLNRVRRGWCLGGAWVLGEEPDRAVAPLGWSRSCPGSVFPFDLCNSQWNCACETLAAEIRDLANVGAGGSVYLARCTNAVAGPVWRSVAVLGVSGQDACRDLVDLADAPVCIGDAVGFQLGGCCGRRGSVCYVGGA
jgi:REP element-mobilizing transposase RayT